MVLADLIGIAFKGRQINLDAVVEKIILERLDRVAVARIVN